MTTAAADNIPTIGLRCNACGEGVNVRMVARSYSVPGGVHRMRYCHCGGEVHSLERVEGVPVAPVQMVVGISGHDLGVLRRIATALGGDIVKLRDPPSRQ